ncbi:MAG: universal stress protein [Pseudomonadales bacterium]|nr:universal stress protein [Pseudomonadales bacterium]
MTQKEELLVVIEPSQENHIALERAILTSRLREVKPVLHLFIGVDAESTDLKARNANLFRDNKWLENLLKPIEEEGLEYTYEFSWSIEWAEALLINADRVHPDLILIPDYEAGIRRSLFSDSKWAILRRSACPVMIVRPGASSHRKRILAAINVQNEDPKYVELNEKIISKSLQVAKLYKAELFVVNAYSDSLNYPNREKIMARTALPSKNVHAEQGDTADIIAEYANRIKADLVVMGTMARKGALSLMRGNTSERLLNRIKQDVITCS